MKGKIISEDDKKYILSLKYEDYFIDDGINFSLLCDLFGTKVTKDSKGKIKINKPRFDPTDEFTLLPNECDGNTEKCRTTIGQLVYNRILFGGGLYKIVGYIHRTINNKQVGKIEEQLSAALMSGKISVDEFINYLDRFQELSMGFHHVIASSFTMRGLKPVPQVIKHRDQLLKQHAKEVEEGDVITIANIEKTLVKEAEEILHDEPSLALYRSGARGSMGNNYKNLSIMRGPIQDPMTGKYDIVKTSFIEGINKQDIAPAGNSVVAGAYPKAVGTAEGGYKFKEMSAALQAIVVDKPGSDCGSKGYVETVIRPSNKSEYLFRYIIENNKLVMLDYDNIDKYVNKVVKMRDAMYCIGDKICAVCAGEQFNKLNIKTIGLASSKVGTTMVNLGMKKFHDSSVKLFDIDINDITL